MFEDISVNEVKRNPEKLADVRKAQEGIWNALPESSRDAYFKFRGRQACIQKAMSKPLPGAAADAFLKGSTKVGEYIVHRVMPIHIACLQAVESPLLQIGQKASESEVKKASAEITDEQQWEMIQIFITYPKVLRKTFDEPSGILEIKKLSKEIESWSAAEINMVLLAITEQYHRHCKTTMRFAAEVQSQGDESFFQALRESQSKPAESAGS